MYIECLASWVTKLFVSLPQVVSVTVTTKMLLDAEITCPLLQIQGILIFCNIESLNILKDLNGSHGLCYAVQEDITVFYSYIVCLVSCGTKLIVYQPQVVSVNMTAKIFLDMKITFHELQCQRMLESKTKIKNKFIFSNNIKGH